MSFESFKRYFEPQTNSWRALAAGGEVAAGYTLYALAGGAEAVGLLALELGIISYALYRNLRES
jgi:hypothetical protein